MPDVSAGVNSDGLPRDASVRDDLISFRFPKSVRLLRPGEFRKVYDTGKRHTCVYFAAFCVADGPRDLPRIGFTTPRALGKAVIRNRIRRRLREAVRLELAALSPEWSIVFNPRRRTLDGTLPELQAEVRRLFIRCSQESLRAQSPPPSYSPSADTNA